MGLKPLRDYQAQAVADVREAFRQKHRRVLLQLCTGGGKTRIMAEIARLAHQKGGCAVVMAPRRELVYQIRGALEEQGIRAGIIMAGHEPDVYADAHVCSIDTISSRVKSERMALPKGSIIITDEGHLFVTRIREEILAAYGDHPHLILTATPALNNGKGMGRIADHMVIASGRIEAISSVSAVPPAGGSKSVMRISSGWLLVPKYSRSSPLTVSVRSFLWPTMALEKSAMPGVPSAKRSSTPVVSSEWMGMRAPVSGSVRTGWWV